MKHDLRDLLPYLYFSLEYQSSLESSHYRSRHLPAHSFAGKVKSKEIPTTQAISAAI